MNEVLQCIILVVQCYYVHVHDALTYRIAGNFRGRKLSRQVEIEDFAKKTFVDPWRLHARVGCIDLHVLST